MASNHHRREEYNQQAPSALRYFKLYTAMAAGGSCLAQICFYRNGSWQPIVSQPATADRLYTVYDRPGGNGAAVDETLQFAWVAGSKRYELVAAPGFYRGVTDAELLKGGYANVTRYEPGTTDPEGSTDVVWNELSDIDAGKVVYYMQSGAKKFVFAAECPLTD